MAAGFCVLFILFRCGEAAGVQWGAAPAAPHAAAKELEQAPPRRLHTCYPSQRCSLAATLLRLPLATPTGCCSLFLIPETKGVPLDKVGLEPSGCIACSSLDVPRAGVKQPGEDACPATALPRCPCPATIRPCQPHKPLSTRHCPRCAQVQERLQTHWLWRHAMRELHEEAQRAEAQAAAKADLSKLSGGGNGEDKEVAPEQAGPVAVDQAPPA